MHTAIVEWSKTTQATRFLVYTEQAYIESWASDMRSDVNNVYVAATVAFIYIVLTLGTCSPIFCRASVALAGAVSVIMPIFSGFGLLFFAGQSIGSLHGSLPFLIIVVGIEQVYVICEAIDQVSL